MGYGYGYNANGRLVLSCDNCGGLGGVRKRHCSFKVLSDSGRGGQRYELHYCYPPALCAKCFVLLGGSKKIHADCAEGAARSQAEYDANQAKLDAGEYMLQAGWGDWAEWVPDGKVGALFVNNAGNEKWALIDKVEYSGSGRYKWLSMYESASEIGAPENQSRSKRVA